MPTRLARIQKVKGVDAVVRQTRLDQTEGSR
jgi:hypothetical protein